MVYPYGRKRVFPANAMAYIPRKRFKSSTKYTSATRSLNKFNTRGPRRSGTLSSQVKSLQKVVNQLKPELKAIDIDVSTTDISATGSVVHLTKIAQGDTQGSRTGNIINIRKLDIGFKLVRTAGYAFTDALNTYFRWAIVVDKEQVSDTAPGAGDAFQSPGEPWLDHPSLVHLERFRYLYVSPCIDLNQTVMYTTSNLLAGSPNRSACLS